MLANLRIYPIIIFVIGGVAHLGERLTGSQKVVGSSPIVSTNIKIPIRVKTAINID